MAGEIPDLKNKARRVKNLALSKAIEILENPGDYNKELYEQTYLTALKNSVPRSQEITGADGADLIPKPILSLVSTNDSNKENRQPEEANTSDSRRDISEQDNLDSSAPDSPSAV